MNAKIEFLRAFSYESVPEEERVKLEKLLFDGEVDIVDGAPTSECARELRMNLKARSENVRYTNKGILGIQHMITAISKMKPDDLIFGYGLISPRAAGNIYFRENDRSVVGVIVVDR